MQPGLTRAVPMGIIGFMLGAAFVVLLRALQSMDPVWDAQLGILMATIGATAFFVWGMGGFNPKLATHHIDAQYDETQGVIVVEDGHGDHEEAEDPKGTLLSQVWLIAFWSVVLAAGLLAFASINGSPAMTISSDAAANTNTIGYYTMDIGGEEVVVSQLTTFIIFVVVVIASLAVVGWVISMTFFSLASGVAAVKAAGNIPLNTLPSSSTAGLLGSGEADAPASTHPAARSASNKARAFVVPNMIYFALIYPNVVMALATFGIGGENQVFLAGLAAIIPSLLLLAILPKDAARQQELAPIKVLGLGAVVFVALFGVFSVIINLVASNATWLYVPAAPVLQNLPLFNAVFLTPFVLDLYFNRGRTVSESIRFLLIPAIVFNALYPVFYGAAIGLIVATDPLRTMLTGVNVAVVTLLVLYAGELLWIVGQFAGWVARVLRGVPHFLGQR